MRRIARADRTRMIGLVSQFSALFRDTIRENIRVGRKGASDAEVEAAGNRIIDAANKEAEDIYAASILYTDGALNEFTNIVDNTRQRLRDEYAYFEECMNQQLEQVRSNQAELLERLQVLAQNKKYLDIINQFAAEE